MLKQWINQWFNQWFKNRTLPHYFPHNRFAQLNLTTLLRDAQFEAADEHGETPLDAKAA